MAAFNIALSTLDYVFRISSECSMLFLVVRRRGGRRIAPPRGGDCVASMSSTGSPAPRKRSGMAEVGYGKQSKMHSRIFCYVFFDLYRV
jgi:hypothetical protein